MEKLTRSKKFLNKLYYIIFKERFNKKINFKFEQNVFRWDIIDYLNNKYSFNSYLEIGCDNDELFSKINIEKKIGVDPIKGGNVKLTSDDFFYSNKETFDCVFIDGLHEYQQVKKDIVNSLKFLNNNGIVLVHDCLPDSVSKQAVPRYRMSWNGDVWKAIVDLRRNPNIEIFTCLVDQGIAIIQNKKNSNILKLNIDIEKLKFRDFYYNYFKYMRIITLEEFKKIF